MPKHFLFESSYFCFIILSNRDLFVYRDDSMAIVRTEHVIIAEREGKIGAVKHIYPPTPHNIMRCFCC